MAASAAMVAKKQLVLSPFLLVTLWSDPWPLVHLLAVAAIGLWQRRSLSMMAHSVVHVLCRRVLGSVRGLGRPPRSCCRFGFVMPTSLPLSQHDRVPLRPEALAHGNGLLQVLWSRGARLLRLWRPIVRVTQL